VTAFLERSLVIEEELFSARVTSTVSALGRQLDISTDTAIHQGNQKWQWFHWRTGTVLQVTNIEIFTLRT
jgi:hypothetical protein